MDLRGRIGAGVLTALVAAGVSACGRADPPFLGTWSDDDVPLSWEELSLYRGEGHCNWERALFLDLAWPPGTGERLQFVRDREGVVSAELSADFDGITVLPADAIRTGYHNESGTQLWLPPGNEPQHAYLVTPSGAVEAWPLADPAWGCD